MSYDVIADKFHLQARPFYSPVVVEMESSLITGAQNPMRIIAVFGDYLDSYVTHENDKQFFIYIESVKMRYPYSCFYAKGAPQCQFLSHLFNTNFKNLDDIGCPDYNTLKQNATDINCNECYEFDCGFTPCARKKVRAFGLWVTRNQFVQETRRSSTQ